MATIMKRIKSIPQHLPVGTAHGKGIKAVVIDKGERFGAAFGFGLAKGYYGDRFIWKGHGADLWLGVGALGAATVLSMFGGRKANQLGEHLERVGDAGVMSALSSLGAAIGLEKAGHSVVRTSGAKAKPVAAVHGIYGDVIGSIPGAKAGPFLSDSDLARFAQRR